MYLVALFLVVLFGEVSSMPKKRERSSGRAGIGMKKKKSGSPVLPSEPRAELLGPRPENERREGQQERKNYFLLPS